MFPHIHATRSGEAMGDDEHSRSCQTESPRQTPRDHQSLASRLMRQAEVEVLLSSPTYKEATKKVRHGGPPVVVFTPLPRVSLSLH